METRELLKKFFDLVKHGDDYINGTPKENCLFIFEFSDITEKNFGLNQLKIIL